MATGAATAEYEDRLRGSGSRISVLIKGRPNVAIVLVSGLLGAVVGAGISLTIPVMHTAESRLVVGSQTVEAQSVPGYALATQQLGVTYARLSTAPAVTQAASAGAKGESVSVSVSPIPESAVLRVEVTSASSASAVGAATAAAQALVVEASKVSANSDDVNRLFAAYTQAQIDASDKASKLLVAKSELQRFGDAAAVCAEQSPPLDLSRACAAEASAQVATSLADLKVAGIGKAYEDAVTAQSQSSSALHATAPGREVRDTRARNAQLGGFFGFVLAGLAGFGVIRRRVAR